MENNTPNKLPINRIIIIINVFLLCSLFLLGILFVRQKAILQKKHDLITLENTQYAKRKQTIKPYEAFVAMSEEGFVPTNLIIPSEKNKIVVFYNTGIKPKEIISTYPNFDSPVIQPNSQYTFVFVQKGLWMFQLKDYDNKKMELIVQ